MHVEATWLCMPIFSGKGVFFSSNLGKIFRESPEKGVIFVIANGDQYPR